MGEKSWIEHWESDDTPWDAGGSAPALPQLLANWPTDDGRRPEGRALVAGCGAGHDVFTLAQAGYTARGIDIAPGVARRFNQLREKFALPEARAELQIADFFENSAKDLGAPYALVWDYTFYCAIEPSARLPWARKMAELLNPEGRLAMLIFPVVPGASADKGPPYALDPEEVTAALGVHFTRLHLAPVLQSHPGREGKEWLAVFGPKSSKAPT